MFPITVLIYTFEYTKDYFTATIEIHKAVTAHIDGREKKEMIHRSDIRIAQNVTGGICTTTSI
jgi:hypothetical protein